MFDNPFSPHRASDALEVHLLGTVDYDAALALQKHLVYEISGRNDRFGTLLLCEHPPLITIGREGSRGDVIADESDLIARQIEVRFENRGGGAIVHSPGQLAIYPVLPLDRLDVGVDRLRSALNTVVRRTAAELRVPTKQEDGATVGMRGSQFSFIGAAVRSWVSYHGLFLNVNPRLDLSRLATPDSGRRVSSLTIQKFRPVAMPAVREAVVRHVSEQFGYDDIQFHTGHPLLTRKTRKAPVHA